MRCCVLYGGVRWSVPEKTSGKTGENVLSRCAVAQGPLHHDCGRHQPGMCVVPFIPSANGTGGVTAGFRGRSVISSRPWAGTPQRCGKAPYIFLHEPTHRSLPNAPSIMQLFFPTVRRLADISYMDGAQATASVPSIYPPRRCGRLEPSHPCSGSGKRNVGKRGGSTQGHLLPCAAKVRTRPAVLRLGPRDAIF